MILWSESVKSLKQLGGRLSPALHRDEKTRQATRSGFRILFGSVADPDPDPPDPHVFGPPGSRSISQKYGSGSGFGCGSPDPDPSIIMQK